MQSSFHHLQNQQSLQYYEYLRTIIQMQQFQYWIGNPKVQIISGKVRLKKLKDIKSVKQPENYQLYIKEVRKSNIVEDNKRNMQDEIMEQCYEKVNNKQQQEQRSHHKQHKQLNKQIHKQSNKQHKQSQQLQQSQPFSTCLCLLGIPTSKPPAQLIQTPIIHPYINLISQIRVMKTSSIKYYSLFLLMSSEQSSQQFYSQLFGCEYNDLQMQRIIIRQIKEMSIFFSEIQQEEEKDKEKNMEKTIMTDSKNDYMKMLKEIKNSIRHKRGKQNENEKQQEYIQPVNIFMTYHYYQLKIKQYQQKQILTPNNPQLTCAICIQPCHSPSISILCGHYFDLCCLQKWSQPICPLCRYHQHPLPIKFCQKCNNCQNLWICLICGSRLCCGIQNDILGEDSHIYQHYKEKGHGLSMEVETRFLFDAKEERFLHEKWDKSGGIKEKRKRMGNNNTNLYDKYEDKKKKYINQQQQQDQQQQRYLKKNKLTQQIKMYQQQVGEQMKNQRLYYQQQINSALKQHRTTLTSKRNHFQCLQKQLSQLNFEIIQTQKSNQLSSSLIQQKQKQLQIIKNLIKMKQSKVLHNKSNFTQYNKKKYEKLKELQNQIKEKKEEILNYRKNLKLKEKFSEKLKNQEIENEIIMVDMNNVNKKKRNK